MTKHMFVMTKVCFSSESWLTDRNLKVIYNSTQTDRQAHEHTDISSETSNRFKTNTTSQSKFPNLTLHS